LVLTDWLAEGLSLLRITQCKLKGSLGNANTASCNIDSTDLKSVHHLDEALTDTVILTTENFTMVDKSEIIKRVEAIAADADLASIERRVAGGKVETNLLRHLRRGQ
jgi:maltodextrin utilization protein YvdJ